MTLFLLNDMKDMKKIVRKVIKAVYGFYIVRKEKAKATVMFRKGVREARVGTFGSTRTPFSLCRGSTNPGRKTTHPPCAPCSATTG